MRILRSVRCQNPQNSTHGISYGHILCFSHISGGKLDLYQSCFDLCISSGLDFVTEILNLKSSEPAKFHPWHLIQPYSIIWLVHIQCAVSSVQLIIKYLTWNVLILDEWIHTYVFCVWHLILAVGSLMATASFIVEHPKIHSTGDMPNVDATDGIQNFCMFRFRTSSIFQSAMMYRSSCFVEVRNFMKYDQNTNMAGWCVTRLEFQILMARSRISWKIWSGWYIDHPDWRRSNLSEMWLKH